MHSGGISARWIILFGLLALAMVLLDGIALSVNRGDSADDRAESYCATVPRQFPAECPVTQVYACGQRYIVRSECVGVGDLIIDQQGSVISWCGYTTFDATQAPDCRPYETHQGELCPPTHNLCSN
ncbi:MAG: hypothetical protein ACOYUK_01470 [Patescibacteria group bacterium]